MLDVFVRPQPLLQRPLRAQPGRYVGAVPPGVLRRQHRRDLPLPHHLQVSVQETEEIQ